jgi:flagellar biosynthetic protein FliR
VVSFTEAEVLAWLTPLLWPFLRALALFSSIPVLGTRTVPMRLRVALSAFIALAAQASLPPIAPVPLDSPAAFILVLQQVVVGLTLGFAVRIVFAAIEFAGEVIGLQMGLNFAGFFDPATASQGTATGRFLGTTVAWLFIVGGGHLLVIGVLVQSRWRCCGMRSPSAGARRSSRSGCGWPCR